MIIRPPNKKRRKWARKKKPRLIKLQKVGKRYAKELAHKITPAERNFKKKLLTLNISFSFQKPFTEKDVLYIADFYLSLFALVIEIDGEYHNTDKQKEYDTKRDKWFHRHGYSVWRLTNKESFNITTEEILHQFGKYKRIKIE